jgi:two-component system response regulator NreC
VGCSWFDEEPDFEVIAQVGDVESVRRSLRTNPPDVLVLDLNMPGESTMDAIPELRAAAPDVQIVVLTMQDEPALAQAVMRAGARAYVLKEAADDELAHAIRLAAAGKSYLNRGLAGRMALERIRSGGWD